MLDTNTIPERAGRVLIVGSRHVGNNVFCTPAIHLLRRARPDARLDVVCTSRRGAETFRGNPDVNDVRYVPTRWQVRRLAAMYDFVIGMYRDVAGRCLRGLRVPHAILEPAPALHRADQRLAFVAQLTGVQPEAADRRYVLPWDATDAAHVTGALGPLAATDRFVGLHLGCGRTATHGWKFWWRPREQDPKMWPLARYVEFAQALRRADPNVTVVITGSTHERFLARRFVADVPGTVDLVGRTTIRSVAALMGRLRLFVTQDTGVLHVACATGVPLIALFGPTNLRATGPYPPSRTRVVLQRETMIEITADEACDAALAILGSPP